MGQNTDYVVSPSCVEGLYLIYTYEGFVSGVSCLYSA